ncbi:MAG TPA: ABC transporter permease [Candidatus Methanoperedenaceae archaeon]|nr:ABC transporter permease [Candidatus Methanoperedenaceae archaeon]
MYLEIPQLTGSVWKVWLRNRDVFMKTFRVNFIPPFIQPLLYLLAIGFGVGTFVNTVDGMPYPKFIAPAIIATGIMNSSFFECTFATYVRMYFQKTFDAIIATPLSIEEVIVGELLWGATRSTIDTILMLPVLAAFGVLEFPQSLLVIPFAFIGGFLFATIAMCFTAITPNIDSLNYPSFLFVTPMFLFSGTFFPLSLLPQPVQYMALAVLPLTHVVIIVRSFTTATLSGMVLLSLGWIVLVSLLFFLLSVNLMKRRLIA